MIYEKYNLRGRLVKCQLFNGMEFVEHQGYYESHKWGRMHRVVYEFYNKCSILPGHEVHHIDEDPSNNDISNLQLMTKSDHIKHHMKDRDKTTEHKDNLSKNHADVSGSQNPMFGKTVYEVWLEKWGKEIADEKQQSMIEKQKISRQGKTPMLGHNHSQEAKQKISESLKGKNTETRGPMSQEHKDKISQALRNKYN
jgi:hypothetical protein